MAIFIVLIELLKLLADISKTYTFEDRNDVLSVIYPIKFPVIGFGNLFIYTLENFNPVPRVVVDIFCQLPPPLFDKIN